MSTVGKEQYLALAREDLAVKIDTSIAGKASIKFSKGEAIVSISTVKVLIDISIITFKVLNIPTLFLLYLIDID